MIQIATLPHEMLSVEIASHMDSQSLACLSATCKKFKFLSKRAKRLAFREEVIRCSKILKQIYEAQESEEFIFLGLPTDMCMFRTIAFLFYKELDEKYRFIDPEIYDDMTMYGCPPDIPLIWNFFKKMCDMGLG